MKRFMIGQHGIFDEKKYERDYRKDFYGIEACMLKDETEVEKLLRAKEQDQLNVGVHFPLRSWTAKVRDPELMSLEKETREGFFKYVEEELKYMQRLKPAYVLFHYPKPVILDDRVDWKQWRFSYRSEYEFESVYPEAAFGKHSEVLFQWLAQKGVEYDFTPVLELDVINRYVYDSDILEGLLKKYPMVRLCLDIARIHLQEKIDSSFDGMQLIRRFVQYADEIHLSNTKADEALVRHHIPVLPELRPAEGWAPVAEYLQLIAVENNAVRVLFEHRSDLVSEEELERCYQWVADLLR